MSLQVIKLLSCLQYCRLLSFVRIVAMKVKYEHRTKSRSQRNNKELSCHSLLTFKIILCPLQTFLELFGEYNAFKSAVRFDLDFIMTKANIKKQKLDFYAKINFQNLLPNFLHNLILPFLFRTQL